MRPDHLGIICLCLAGLLLAGCSTSAPCINHLLLGDQYHSAAFTYGDNYFGVRGSRLQADWGQQLGIGGTFKI